MKRFLALLLADLMALKPARRTRITHRSDLVRGQSGPCGDRHLPIKSFHNNMLSQTKVRSQMNMLSLHHTKYTPIYRISKFLFYGTRSSSLPRDTKILYSLHLHNFNPFLIDHS